MPTPMNTLPSSPSVPLFNINRRRFLHTASGTLAVSTLGSFGADIVNQKPRRVGLIGAGWYGKSDLWRLAQVAPIEIVALCDPDKHMLAGAVEIAKQRQKSGKAPLTQWTEGVRPRRDDARRGLKRLGLDPDGTVASKVAGLFPR